MAISTINIGNVVNDGLGDDLRTAFQKVNTNFQDLEERFDTRITARNIGETGQGVFAQIVGSELQFKNLVSGTGILLDGTSSSIVINATQPIAFSAITTSNDSNTISASTTTSLTFVGTEGIEVTSNGSNINFGLSGTGISAINVYDFGPLGGNHPNVISFILSTSNTDFGSILIPSTLNLNLGAIV